MGFDKAFHLAFRAPASSNYNAWATSNFSDWCQIGSAIEVAPGSYQFIDAAATNQPCRFYQLRSP